MASHATIAGQAQPLASGEPISNSSDSVRQRFPAGVAYRHVYTPLPREEVLALFNKLAEEFQASNPGVDPVEELMTERRAEAARE